MSRATLLLRVAPPHQVWGGTERKRGRQRQPRAQHAAERPRRGRTPGGGCSMASRAAVMGLANGKSALQLMAQHITGGLKRHDCQHGQTCVRGRRDRAAITEAEYRKPTASAARALRMPSSLAS